MPLVFLQLIMEVIFGWKCVFFKSCKEVTTHLQASEVDIKFLLNVFMAYKKKANGMACLSSYEHHEGVFSF